MKNINQLDNYNYIIYGLRVSSQMPLPELVETDNLGFGTSEVTITYGIVPKVVKGAVVINSEYIKLAKSEFYLNIEGTAHYYVADGNKIIVELQDESDVEDIKVYLLGSCFGVLLHQRNSVAIHGSSIALNEQGVIITGHTGAGKSTLTSALIRKGYPFLADDVSALGKSNNNQILIYPAYPQTKLCRDAAEKMGYNVKEFKVTDPERDKFAIPSRKNFWGQSITLKSIFEICTGDVVSVEIKEILGVEKINLILRNIYRIEVNKVLGFCQEYFKFCVEIAQRVSIYRIIRPKHGFTVDEQIDLIETAMMKNSMHVLGG